MKSCDTDWSSNSENSTWSEKSHGEAAAARASKSQSKGIRKKNDEVPNCNCKEHVPDQRERDAAQEQAFQRIRVAEQTESELRVQLRIEESLTSSMSECSSVT